MPKSLIKSIIFTGIFIVISLTFFWIVGTGFDRNVLNFDNWIYIIAAAGVFAVAFSLFALNDFENKKINLAVFGIIGILAFISAPVINGYIFGSIIILLVVLFFGERRIKNNLLSSFKVSFYDATGEGLKLIFEGLMIVIIIFYYFSPAGAVLLNGDISVPRPIFDTIFDVVIKSLAGEEQGSSGLVGNLIGNNALTMRQVNIVEKQISNEVYNSINASLKSFVGPYKKYVPIVLALGLYLTIRFFAIFIRLLSGFFSWLIVKFLFLFGVMRKKTITVEREYFE